ncbi:MAG: sulfurtransferase [Nitrospirae bacterium CG18_big_fil_WC_8_21_14_2_50_70_55]|nr:rhodanese-like domain-containing protein [Deltaproteobacteria bacterium]OIP64605.1 MAG: hypothetical protein AUK30_06570 [Nitrospirae bacterium CG2_30_70_394]PIQ03379.1 MAG: sulfurtransferase [Nitrospirae bacterium CG18_big_fil_WC_8_21_14_2_50_70_55]PIU79713.1 MAG: rhodanese-like domain-containing protein [Nitrospirae bacterium CG06_land_8_20_14_3_00_70_43]PIW83622.1 MAG: rhodanese-like domain-containing protein [Nitrospirae bacterium CG_4_8_14_3_um_filter_70_85]PIX82428.1 MAG: rhodanese-li
MHTLRSFVTAVTLLLVVAACARAVAGGDVAPGAALQVQQSGAVLLDVRTPEEFAGGHAAGAQLVPWLYGGGRPNPEFVEAVGKLAPPDQPLVVICQSGSRSAQAAARLRGAGYQAVYNVAGGSVAWRQAQLPWVAAGR